MEKHNHNALLTGAIIGGALGIVAAYKLADSLQEEPQRTFFSRASETQSSSVNPLIAAGITTLVGLGAGLLLAPKSGKELREDISDIVDNIQDKTHEFTSDLGEQGSDFIHSFTEQASDLVEKAKHMANHVSDTVSQKGHKVKKEALTDTLENAINMANIGFRIWNSLSKGR